MLRVLHIALTIVIPTVIEAIAELRVPEASEKSGALGGLGVGVAGFWPMEPRP